MPVLRELEEEFPLMASMGDMPYVAGQVMSLCPCHTSPAKTLFLPSKNAI
jgi:hypothetical protein